MPVSQFSLLTSIDRVSTFSKALNLTLLTNWPRISQRDCIPGLLKLNTFYILHKHLNYSKEFQPDHNKEGIYPSKVLVSSSYLDNFLLGQESPQQERERESFLGKKNKNKINKLLSTPCSKCTERYLAHGDNNNNNNDGHDNGERDRDRE